ncbi:ubiquinol oxidase subunit II [Sphingomonas elodea]|uniref:ubiquinol oxidase subunit II n=1 Tax=Sphingomonas elodea TaxID=179878 RepID=UPI0004958856|nr:ubiquinol oxidase subunit II [Sphingomonas elodea]
MPPFRRALRPTALIATLAAPLILGGCDLVVMNPSGDVARQQADLILWSTFLMLLIIVPVMALTVFFAFKYRASNTESEYDPDWDHSTRIELVIWSAPLLIIIALGALTWLATHKLDPYRPLDRIAPGKPIPADQRPLEIQVVSLDWKWLFIYPEQGVATVNELVLPADRQVRFRMTSSSVMNTFYVPAMAGMIYTMPGMETKLHAVMNRVGTFEGVSANYSGAGFSDMRFPTLSVDAAGFDQWVAKTKASGGSLDAAQYLTLEKPSEKVPAMHFGAIEAGLFDRIVQMCVKPGTTCSGHMMHHGAGAQQVAPPVNNKPGEGADGALMKAPDEMKTSPHLTHPHGAPAGHSEPGADSNRNMTRMDATTYPGRAAAGEA